MFACRARDYSAPVNFISAGLKKAAAEEAELQDSDDEEKPVTQDEFPKDFGPKKLKTVASSSKDRDLSNILGRSSQPKHLLASRGPGGAQLEAGCVGFSLCWFLRGVKCSVQSVSCLTHITDIFSVYMMLFLVPCDCWPFSHPPRFLSKIFLPFLLPSTKH